MDNKAHSCVCFVSVSEFGFIITRCTKENAIEIRVCKTRIQWWFYFIYILHIFILTYHCFNIIIKIYPLEYIDG